MSGRTVLVSGGAGFIGSHLAERLLADGDRVAVVDDLSSGKTVNLGGEALLERAKRPEVNRQHARPSIGAVSAADQTALGNVKAHLPGPRLAPTANAADEPRAKPDRIQGAEFQEEPHA